tara:strand:- start:343 stop:492 length:150 start_codon:yes stop_codon:yes gene_type:complete
VKKLQIYTADELKILLEKAGGKLIKKGSIDGQKFNRKKLNICFLWQKKW